MIAKYVGKERLDEALVEYLKKVQHCDSFDVTMMLMDFKDPYTCCWIGREFVEDIEVDGKDYTVYACYTDFYHFRTFNNEDHFKFYMLMHREDPGDHTVGAYMRSERLYIVDEKYFEDDFPKWVG